MMVGLMGKQKIIISHYREGKTQRQIHREATISRKTIPAPNFLFLIPAVLDYVVYSCFIPGRSRRHSIN